MKATSTAIVRFIQDFKLMNAQGVVNFMANIELKANNITHIIKSEVFILSVDPKQIDAVHLLSTDIAEKNFPIMFQSGKEVFSYIDDVCLMIIGNNAEKGDFVISVYPEASSASVSLQ